MTDGPRILVCDDEPGIRKTLSQILDDEGYTVDAVGLGQDALARAFGDEDQRPEAIFLDVWLPDLDGLTVLDRLRAAGLAMPVVMISGHGTVDTAVQAVKRGADDFLEKPLSLERVLLTLYKALERYRLARERDDLRRELMSRTDDAAKETLLGTSPAMMRLLDEIRRAGASEARVLIMGESGVGKELVARALHRASPRAAGPLHRGQRRGDSGGAHRERALRAREGLVHGRDRRPQGEVGAGRRRHALPRRDRRHVAAHAGQDPARHPGRAHHARRRRQDVRDGRAHRRRDESRPARDDPRGDVPRRSLFPAGRRPAARGAPVRAARGHSPPRGALRRESRAPARAAPEDVRKGGARGPREAAMAGQRARAAEPRRTRPPHVDGAGRPGRGSPARGRPGRRTRPVPPGLGRDLRRTRRSPRRARRSRSATSRASSRRRRGTCRARPSASASTARRSIAR